MIPNIYDLFHSRCNGQLHRNKTNSSDSQIVELSLVAPAGAPTRNDSVTYHVGTYHRYLQGRMEPFCTGPGWRGLLASDRQAADQ